MGSRYMLHALTLGNATRVAEKLLMFNVNASPVDHDKFTAELQRVMGLYINTSAGRPGPNVQPVNMGVMMGHILMVLQEHKVSLRSDVAMTIVTMSISEGLVRRALSLISASLCPLLPPSFPPPTLLHPLSL